MNKEVWMNRASEKGITDFEIYEQKTSSTSIQLYEQSVDTFTISECDGIALRGIYKGKMGYCSLEHTADEHIEYALDQLISNANAISSTDAVELYAGDTAYAHIKHKKHTISELSSTQKIDLLKRIEKSILASDTRITQVMSNSYMERSVTRSIMNSKGLNIKDCDIYSMIYVEVLAKDESDAKSDSDWCILHDINDLNVEQFASELSKKVCAKLHAEQIPSANYPVLMYRDAMSELLYAFNGLFDGENAYKGISILKDQIGQKIFDENITMIDDPLMEDGNSSTAFDDEGVACKTKTIVENGMLKTYLHNLKSAKLMNIDPTGNGFKKGYASSVGISPTNFYIENGTHSYEAMVQQMNEGVIITNLTGLHAGLNQVSTEFSLQASGFYVKDGCIVKPINLITVAGNFMEAMKHIDKVGNDLKMYYNGIGTPSIYFHSLAISGE